MGDARVLRLFVAIYPPEGIARDLLRLMRSQDPPSYRQTPLDQVHVTLQFIGDTPGRDLDDTRESVVRSAGGLGSFCLTPQRLVTLPQRGRPRLIAAETDAPATLLEIKRRLVQRLARQPRERAEQDFRPHLTLCRFTHSARPARADTPIDAPGFEVNEIVLVRSVLRPEGALHSPVERVPLRA